MRAISAASRSSAAIADRSSYGSAKSMLSSMRCTCPRPSSDGATRVRNTDWRMTTSRSACSNNATSMAPVSRWADGVLNSTRPGCSSSRKRMRSCATVSGARSCGPSWRTSGRAGSSLPDDLSMTMASASAVGDSNTVRSGSFRPNSAFSRVVSRMASSEWPPSAKKPSRTLMPGKSSTASIAASTLASTSLRGATRSALRSPATPAGLGREWRSSLPLCSSGSLGRKTKCCGIMYAGSVSPRWRRNSPSSVGAPLATR